MEHRPGVGYTDKQGVTHYCPACQQDWENRTMGWYIDAHHRENYGLPLEPTYQELQSLGADFWNKARAAAQGGSHR
jgi:hypothetical protein